jgi:hypothetical protein
MVNSERVLEIVKQKGPMLPTQIVSELGGTGTTNSFFVGALLSELIAINKIKVTKVKVGGSPLYYTIGQEEKLVDYLKYMHEKERIILEKLKENKILRDSELEAAQRVALNNSKDYARPLEVTLKQKEIFWKWFLVPNQEAEMLIKKILQGSSSTSSTNYVDSRNTLSEENQNNKVNNFNNQYNNFKTESNKTTNNDSEDSIFSNLQREKNYDENNKTNYSNNNNNDKTNINSNSIGNNNNFNSSNEFVNNNNNNNNNNDKERDNYARRSIDEKPVEKIQSNLSNDYSDDSFFINTKNKLKSMDIKIISSELIKKNNDAEFVISLPTAIGNITYYCYAKNKKKITDSDISLAYAKAQSKNLPLVFISTGELNKRAEDILDDELKSVKFKKI